MATGAGLLPSFLAREDEDRREDEDGADEVEEAERDVQEGDGEQDGREGLGGAQDARLAGLDVLQAAEVAAEGDDGAEDDDVGKEQGGRLIPDTREGERVRNGDEEQAAEEHAPARDERRAPLADEALGLDGVEGRG